MRIAMALGLVLLVAADILSAGDGGYDSHGKRNPFVPPAQIIPARDKGGEGVDTSSLEQWFSRSLNGIIWDADSPYALIGDRIVSVGDIVRDCTILEIGQKGIVFSYMDKRFSVPIREKETPEDGN